MLTRERARIFQHDRIAAGRVDMPQQQQRSDERHPQQVGVALAQPALVDQPAHQLLHAFRSAAQPLVQIEAAGPRQAHAVGHQQAKQHLLARIEKALDAAEREALEQGAGVGDRSIAGQRGQPLRLGVFVREDQRIEQRLLALEVVIERALAHADGGGHVAQAGAEIALVGEQLERGVEDGLAGALAIGVLGSCHIKLMVVHLINSVNSPGRATERVQGRGRGGLTRAVSRETTGSRIIPIPAATVLNGSQSG